MSGGTPIRTDEAPPPAGPYSQAIRAGDIVYLSGQTPRDAVGNRLGELPFEAQVRQTLTNLEAVARASGGSLADAVKVTVYLAPGRQTSEFNTVYAEFFAEPGPARTTIVSELANGVTVEVDAVLWLPEESRE
ncbi:RidA family protein [Agreia sp. PsM10]|uniref:RidA family protein n=1 Tax=Agreia sp. PsM10 TaxID=3030533 RepID=UPI00263AC045|nr:RidA family protein [Agreia sp. PsM10]MDN4641044.1 RidA family protein [Agreia sp. PsM10]